MAFRRGFARSSVRRFSPYRAVGRRAPFRRFPGVNARYRAPGLAARVQRYPFVQRSRALRLTRF